MRCSLVPTLEYDGKPLYESNVICEFLEEGKQLEHVFEVGYHRSISYIILVYPTHGLTLQPSDPYQRAISRIWSDYITSRVIPAFHRFLQFQPGQSAQPLSELRAEFHEKLREFTTEMDEEGPYFFGTEPKLVDFVMAPFAVRLWVFDKYKEGGSGCLLWAKGASMRPRGRGGGSGLVRLKVGRVLGIRRVGRISITPSIRNSEYQAFSPCFHVRLADNIPDSADNVAQSELAKATRSGWGVP